mmetsp:Transcript_68553/g.193549  ORF Transcript_68553/g.193549 Transcript_68553/m.193549 type:complete len:203 (-) Transcript_68553:390-998(-)
MATAPIKRAGLRFVSPSLGAAPGTTPVSSPGKAVTIVSLATSLVGQASCIKAVEQSITAGSKNPARIITPHRQVCAASSSQDSATKCVASNKRRKKAHPRREPAANADKRPSNKVALVATTLERPGARRITPTNVIILMMAAAPRDGPHSTLPGFSAALGNSASGSTSSPALSFRKWAVFSNSVGTCSVKKAAAATPLALIV